MHKILLNHVFFPKQIDAGLAGFENILVEELHAGSPELRDAKAILSLLSTKIDQKFLDNAPALKVIANYAVGYDNIDLDACKERGIWVTNTPDVLTNATAELTLALVFSCARHIVQSHLFCQNNQFKGWKPDLFVGKEIKGLNACIVGQGRIGQRTAELFEAVGMHVTFITRHHSESQVDQILSNSEVISLHIPYRKNLHHWLDKRRLNLLPKAAIVINTARGKVIDEQALVEKVLKGDLYAGLDVYEYEPLIPQELKDCVNCTLIPHTGSATFKARQEMLKLSIESICHSLDGIRPLNCLT